jgi:hypothetical protein
MEICSYYPHVTINNQVYHSTTVYSWVKKADNKQDYKFFCAILNSSLFWWFLKNTGDTLQNDARRMKTNYLNPFPLPATVSAQAEKEIVDAVDKLMQLKINGDSEEAAKLENDINQLVYKLYDLADDERELVKSSVK